MRRHPDLWPPAPGGGPSLLGRALRLLLLPVIIAVSAGLVAAGISPLFGGVGQAIKTVDRRFLGPTGADLTIRPFPQRSTIFAADGSVLAILADFNRVSVPLDRVNEVARLAVLAIEDDRFYEHRAVDVTAILRAAIANWRARDVVQGGSTISQQVIKNAFGRTEQTFQRKFQEAQDAIRLERTYSKDQILELYLNQVYFGNGAYGIQAAAEHYFARPASRLTLSQAALLAGMIKAPEVFDPIDNRPLALARRNVVLGRMRDLGWITEAEYLEAVAEKIKLSGKMRTVNRFGPEPHFVDYVRQQIIHPDPESAHYRRFLKVFGRTPRQRERTLYRGGLRIYTTLRPRLQEAAREAVEHRLPNQGPRPPWDPQAAVVSIVPQTGAIRALYGGRDFSREQFNLATQSTRGAGSAFKAFTLVAALERGIPPGKVYRAQSPTRVPFEKCPTADGGPWTPSNAEGSRAGFLNLWDATKGSVNVVFAQLIADVGPSYVADAARRMGVRGPNVYIPAVCAITLGSVSVNPLAMTAGYATLANGGIRCEPFAIARVVDRDGKTVFRARPSCQRAVRAQIAAQVTAMLRRVVETGGTGWRANIGRPQAGKTGTGQDYKDAWFMGYVPQLATGVWVGYANREYAMRGLRVLGGGNAFGGTIAAPIWHDYMVKAVQGMPVRDFPKPPPEKRGTVPNVVGLRQRQAVSVLTEADFTPIVRMVDSLEPRGVVVAQSPAAGTTAPLGIAVTIDVSTGVAPRTRVPRVVGLRLPEARDRLLRAGFAVEVVEVPVQDPGQDGVVVGQDPRGGSTRPQGTTVTIRVGRLEAEPSPSP